MSPLAPFVSLVVSVCICATNAAGAQSDPTHWQQLPSIPDAIGFAAPFAGVSGGALVVAGGANFPDAMPWEGGKKVWHDSVFVLEKPDGKWQAGFKLPRPIGYGVSVTTRQGVLCAGGSDSREHFRDVFLLGWRRGKIDTRSLPPLPGPMANGCAALVENTVYLAGGTDKPDATNALRTFWSLNLSEAKPQWRELEAWPGPPRMLAVAGVKASDRTKSFFLFSGADLSASPTGQPARRYLRDAYRYTPGKGWRRLADLPRAAVAAPTPAISHDHQLLIVSGDDGESVNFEPKSAHPGFPKDILAYDPAKDRWARLGDSPISRATIPVVPWKGLAIIPGGEAKPGRRTPEVWALVGK